MNLTTLSTAEPSPDQQFESDLELNSTIEWLMIETRSMLQRRIWLETAQRIFVAGTVWFFTAWALDYFPIWLGASELPQVARLVLLLLGLSIIGWIVFRWGWNRSRVKASDQSIALLMEHHYPQLADRLATLVSMRERQADDKTGSHHQAPPWSDIFLRGTTDGLLEDLRLVRLKELFDWSSVKRWSYYCFAAFSLLLLTLVVTGSWFQIAFCREVLLDSRRWPRQSDIELGQFKPVLNSRLGQLLGESPELSKIEGQYRVGRGSDLELIIEASTGRPADTKASIQSVDQFQIAGFSHRVPRRCVMTYRLADGSNGRQYLTKFGQTESGREGFRYDGPPLQRITESLQVTIYGDDDRVGPLQLTPVDNVAVLKIELQCQFPGYLERSGGTQWLPQALPWTEGMRLPVGTRLEAKFQFSKPVQRLLLTTKGEGEPWLQWQNQTVTTEVVLPLKELTQQQDWELWAQDIDQVWTPEPMLFSIEAKVDQAPVLQADLQGIENAVTPDAILPIVATASDDYGLQSVSAKLQLPVTLLNEAKQFSSEPANQNDEPGEVGSATAASDVSQIEMQMSANVRTEGYFQTAVDLRQWYQKYQKVASLKVDQQQTIQLQVMAKDYYEQDGQTHQSVSQTIHLEVVSPATLLRLLKRSEVGQRRRLEQIYDELMDQRFYLQRSTALLTEIKAGKILDDATANKVNQADGVDSDSGIDPREMVGVFARRAKNQNEKSRQELVGVQAAFEKIVQQIVNNRLEAAEYRRRLEANIIRSMQQLTETEIVAAGNLLGQLESKLSVLNEAKPAKESEVETENEARKSTGDPVHDSSQEELLVTLNLATDSNDRCLKILDQILQDLLKFESDAELYELVREIYDNQKRLMDETGRQQQEQAFEDLFGN